MQKKPWYKQFWPWFVIALPASSVVYSLTAVYIFSQNQVDLVAEDYYKKGKAINVDISRLRVADALKLHATVAEKKIKLRLNLIKENSEVILIYVLLLLTVHLLIKTLLKW
jgi:uncharacterized protein